MASIVVAHADPHSAKTIADRRRCSTREKSSLKERFRNFTGATSHLFVGDGLGEISFVSTRVSFGMVMAQDHAQHHVPLGEDAEQLAAIDHGNSAHGVLGHYFYRLQHGRVGCDSSRRNTGNLKETHRGLRRKRLRRVDGLDGFGHTLKTKEYGGKGRDEPPWKRILTFSF